MRSLHSLDRLDVTFDDEHVVADAGLMLPATLAEHLELREFIDATVDLGDAAGRANVGHKAMTLIHSALAGGDCIDDADALRAGDTEGGTRSRGVGALDVGDVFAELHVGSHPSARPGERRAPDPGVDRGRGAGRRAGHGGYRLDDL